MPRRKGELTPAALDRKYPFQVILPARCYSGPNYKIILEFCKGMSLARRGPCCPCCMTSSEWPYLVVLNRHRTVTNGNQATGATDELDHHVVSSRRDILKNETHGLKLEE